jgi:hypothetical protein
VSAHIDPMKPFLVRAHIPDLGPPPGAIVIYVVLSDDESSALIAVESPGIAKGRTGFEVIGTALESLARRRNLQPNVPELLA